MNQTDFGTIHFRSDTLRPVSCYTFLSGFQPSWPPSGYPEQATSFVGSWYEPAFRICKSTLGAPRIASTAYQSWPTWAPVFPWLFLFFLVRTCSEITVEALHNMLVQNADKTRWRQPPDPTEEAHHYIIGLANTHRPFTHTTSPCHPGG